MTRRIFRGIALTALAAVLLAAAFITLTLYAAYEARMADSLRAEAGHILHALSREADDAAYFDGFRSENRVTLVAPDGRVLYDSGADAGSLPNHAERPEIAAALASGRGQSRRYSDTLAETTVYYAERTPSGNVLRVSNTQSSVLGLIWRMLPALLGIVLGVALLSLIVARMIARRIVTPVNALDLDAPLNNDAYDELSPLLLRVDRQKKELAAQMAALDAKQRELAAITENMREGLILLDQRSVVLSMNGSAARIFGVEAAGRAGGDMLAVTRDAAVSGAVAAAQAGESAEAVFERGGRYYQLLANPALRDGGTAGVVLLLLDVTEKRAAELSRREFTANVSHELKTPLTSISGYAEIMRDGVARPEDMRAFAGRIYAEANRLIALVNDILELSRLDERKGLGERERVALLPLIRRVASRLAPLAEEKGVALSIEAEDVAIDGFPALIDELVFNLADNAVKYTDAGTVRIEAAQEADGVRLCVWDTGIGIPQEHQAHVFERFYRVDKSHSRATGGTGLGLSIVKHAAAVHGADIALTSAPGQGTRVEIVFPAATV